MLSIVTIPDPILKKVAVPVQQITPEIWNLAEDMAALLRHYPHCVGVAAPQVGKSARMVVIDCSLALKPCVNHGLLTLINPVIIRSEGKRLGREGCLSIPDFTGNVVRAEKITVNAMTTNGAQTRVEAEGFEAVVLQHEIDHLDGILFLDRVSSLKTDVFRRKK